MRIGVSNPEIKDKSIRNGAQEKVHAAFGAAEEYYIASIYEYKMQNLVKSKC
jgi:hypothetical protein